MNELERAVGNVIKGEKRLGEDLTTVKVGNISLRINGLNGDLKTRLDERYEGYGDGGSDSVQVYAYYGRDCFVKPEKEGMLSVTEFESEKGIYYLSQDFSGFISKDKNDCFVLLNEKNEPRSIVLAIENFLIRIFYLMSLELGGFFLHSCGLVNEKKAYIFYGVSGSGKSAIATLSPELQILSDDLVLIFPHNGNFFASSTPFWGSIARSMRTKGFYEIGGIYRLVKSTDTELKKIDTVKALTTIFSSAFIGGFSQKRSSKLFENIKSFLRGREVFELKLPLQPIFWELITK